MLGAFRSRTTSPISEKPRRWCGWRRKRFTHDAWKQVEASAAGSRSECYRRLMDSSEWERHEGEYEYDILPEGVSPELF